MPEEEEATEEGLAARLKKMSGKEKVAYWCNQLLKKYKREQKDLLRVCFTTIRTYCLNAKEHPLEEKYLKIRYVHTKNRYPFPLLIFSCALWYSWHASISFVFLSCILFSPHMCTSYIHTYLRLGGTATASFRNPLAVSNPEDTGSNGDGGLRKGGTEARKKVAQISGDLRLQSDGERTLPG